MIKYFFAFQNKNYYEESNGGYLWAPLYSRNHRKVSSWESLEKVKRGDLILHCCDRKIKAIGIAVKEAVQAPSPRYEDYGQQGRLVEVKYIILEQTIKISDYMAVILPLLQTVTHSPFNRNGKGNQGYVFNINKEMFNFIAEVILNMQEDILTVDKIKLILNYKEDAKHLLEKIKFYDLSPYPFLSNGDKDVYVQLNVLNVEWDCGEEIGITLEFSLLNQLMLENDQNLLGRNNDRKHCTMFFYEFTTTKYVNKNQLQSFWPILLKAYGLISPNERVKDYYFDNNLIFKLLEEASGPKVWLHGRIYDFEQDKTDCDEISDLLPDVFWGKLLFSASPVLSKNCFIQIKIEEDGKEINIYDDYDFSRFLIEKCDEDKLKKSIDNRYKIHNRKIKPYIYNVGQANCIYNYLDSLKFFFDIGITKAKDDRKTVVIKNAFNEISELYSDMVILSHWDMDHILGVTIAHESVYRCLWIAPFPETIKGNSVSIKRLCGFLDMNGAEIVLVGNSFNQEKVYESEDKQITIWKGENKSYKGVSIANNSGLILKLKYKHSILMMGDCENSLAPNDIFDDDYKYVIVSHHGSKMSLPKLKKYEKKGGKAIVSIGWKTGNFKEDEDLKEKYEKIGYSLTRTRSWIKTKNSYPL